MFGSCNYGVVGHASCVLPRRLGAAFFVVEYAVGPFYGSLSMFILVLLLLLDVDNARG